jgi:Rod binding domain-containing protein
MDMGKVTSTVDINTAKLLVDQSASIKQSTVASPQSKTETQIRSSAQGFERILIRQMLSTMRNPSIRGDDDTRTASSGYLEMADDTLADTLSKGKGMGFGDKMAQSLLQQASVKQLIVNDQKAVNNKPGGQIVYPSNTAIPTTN